MFAILTEAVAGIVSATIQGLGDMGSKSAPALLALWPWQAPQLWALVLPFAPQVLQEGRGVSALLSARCCAEWVLSICGGSEGVGQG